MSNVRTRPVPAAPPEWRFPAFERHTLASGLDVLACHLPDRPVMDIRLVLDGGMRRETAELAGLGHIVTRSLMEGTTAKSGDDFNEALELLGSHFNVLTEWNGLVPTLTTPRSQLLPALELLTEVVTSPGFRDEDVLRAIRRRIDETPLEDVNPMAAAANAFCALAFPSGSRMAQPRLGSRESLANLHPDLVRNWWTSHADPSTGALIVVGDLRELDLVAMLDKTVATWDVVPPARPPLAPEAAAPGRQGTIIDLPQGVQTTLFFGQTFHAVPFEDRAPLQVAVQVLGGYFASRLVTKLREEKGITYGVNAGVQHRVGCSVLQVTTAVEAKATAEAVAGVLDEIVDVREGLTDAEVRMAADNLIGRGPVAYVKASAVAHSLQSIAMNGLPDDFVDRTRAAMSSLTAEGATDAFRRYIEPADIKLAAAGPATMIADAIGTTYGEVTTQASAAPALDLSALTASAAGNPAAQAALAKLASDPAALAAMMAKMQKPPPKE